MIELILMIKVDKDLLLSLVRTSFNKFSKEKLRYNISYCLSITITELPAEHTDLEEQCFGTNEEFQEAAETYLNTLAETYKEGVGKLVQWYDKCLNIHRYYVEKELGLYSTLGNENIVLFISVFSFWPQLKLKKISLMLV